MAPNAGHGTEIGIEVSYEADLGCIVMPAQMWLVAIRGEKCSRTVYLRSDALDALHLRDLRCDIPGLRVARTDRLSKYAELRPAEEALAVRLEGTFEHPGIFEGSFTASTDSADVPQIKIPIAIRVVDLWVAEPAGFPFILRPDGEAASAKVRLFARDKRSVPDEIEVRVESHGAPVTGLRARVSRKADHDCEITVDLNQKELGRDAGVADVVVKDGSGATVRTVPLAWVVLRHTPPPAVPAATDHR